MAKIFYFNNYASFPAQQFGGELGLPIEFDGVTIPEAVQVGPDDDWRAIASPQYTSGFVGLKPDGKLWGAGFASSDYIHGVSDVLYAPGDLGFVNIFTDIYTPLGFRSSNRAEGIFARDLGGQIYFLGAYPFAGLTFDAPFFHTEPTPVPSLPVGTDFKFFATEDAGRAIVDGVQYTTWLQTYPHYNLEDGPLAFSPAPFTGMDLFPPDQGTYTLASYPIDPVQFGSLGNQDAFSLTADGTLYLNAASGEYASGGFLNYQRIREPILTDVASFSESEFSAAIFYITTSGELRWFNALSSVLYTETGGVPRVLTPILPVVTYAVFPGVQFDRVAINDFGPLLAARRADTKEVYTWDIIDITGGFNDLTEANFPLPDPVIPMPGVAIADFAFNSFDNGCGIFLLTDEPPRVTDFWENLRGTRQY